MQESSSIVCHCEACRLGRSNLIRVWLFIIGFFLGACILVIGYLIRVLWSPHFVGRSMFDVRCWTFIFFCVLRRALFAWLLYLGYWSLLRRSMFDVKSWTFVFPCVLWLKSCDLCLVTWPLASAVRYSALRALPECTQVLYAFDLFSSTKI